MAERFDLVLLVPRHWLFLLCAENLKEACRSIALL